MESVYTFNDSEDNDYFDNRYLIANHTLSNAPSLYLSTFGSRKVSNFHVGPAYGSRPDLLAPTVLEAYSHKKEMTDAERTSLLSESLDYLTPTSGGSSSLNGGPINDLPSSLTREHFNNIAAASSYSKGGVIAADNSSVSNTTHSGEDKFNFHHHHHHNQHSHNQHSVGHFGSETSSRRDHGGGAGGGNFEHHQQQHPLPPGTFYSASIHSQSQMRTIGFNMRPYNIIPRVNISGDPSTNEELDFRNQNMLDINMSPAFFNPSRFVPNFEHIQPITHLHDKGSSSDPLNMFGFFSFHFSNLFFKLFLGIEVNYLLVKNIDMILVEPNLKPHLEHLHYWQGLQWLHLLNYNTMKIRPIFF
jgi:hypothetical protein